MIINQNFSNVHAEQWSKVLKLEIIPRKETVSFNKVSRLREGSLKCDIHLCSYWTKCLFDYYNFSCIVKLGNRCTLKLEKATKALFTGFFSCYLSQRCPMARTVLKHKHMASKFNPGVKMMFFHSALITFSESYLLHISFQLLCTNFSGCARITKCAQ